MVTSESATSTKLRKHQKPLGRPKKRALADTLIAEGLTDTEVGRRLGISRQAITAYKKNHPAGIAKVVAEVERQITDYAIAHKVNRIAGLQSLAEQVQAVIDDRGLIERTITTTENAEIVRERFAREISAELRSIYRATAEELAELPRAPDVSVNVNVGVAVALAWSDGTQA